MKCVHRTADRTTAQLLRGALEVEQIPAIVEGEHLGALRGELPVGASAEYRVSILDDEQLPRATPAGAAVARGTQRERGLALDLPLRRAPRAALRLVLEVRRGRSRLTARRGCGLGHTRPARRRPGGSRAMPVVEFAGTASSARAARTCASCCCARACRSTPAPRARSTAAASRCAAPAPSRIEGEVSEPTPGEIRRLSLFPHRPESGLRLACQVSVLGDLKVTQARRLVRPAHRRAREAEQRQKETPWREPVQIIGSPISPYVRKVLVCLELKKLDYEIDPIVPFFGDDRFSQLSPLRRIPVLIDDRVVARATRR